MPRTAEVSFPSSEIDLSPIMERAGAKERPKIEKHLAACDEEPTPHHGRLWRRLAIMLGELAPLGVQSSGSNAWRFFIQDGKYRMQVFALEDQFDGNLNVYLPDVLDEAIKRKIIKRTADPAVFDVKDSDNQLRIDALDAENTLEAPAHYKHMLGWNRKALRLTLPTTDADGALITAVGIMLSLAARQWSASSAKATSR
jgi:hypothetical protein